MQSVKRVNASKVLVRRIERLIVDDVTAREATFGPNHDPTGGTEATIDVRSALGRFLTAKGYVNVEIGADMGRFYTVITVSLRRRPRGQAPVLDVTVLSI